MWTRTSPTFGTRYHGVWTGTISISLLFLSLSLLYIKKTFKKQTPIHSSRFLCYHSLVSLIWGIIIFFLATFAINQNTPSLVSLVIPILFAQLVNTVLFCISLKTKKNSANSKANPEAHLGLLLWFTNWCLLKILHGSQNFLHWRKITNLAYTWWRKAQSFVLSLKTQKQNAEPNSKPPPQDKIFPGKSVRKRGGVVRRKEMVKVLLPLRVWEVERCWFCVELGIGFRGLGAFHGWLWTSTWLTRLTWTPPFCSLFRTLVTCPWQPSLFMGSCLMLSPLVVLVECLMFPLEVGFSIASYIAMLNFQ